MSRSKLSSLPAFVPTRGPLTREQAAILATHREQQYPTGRAISGLTDEILSRRGTVAATHRRADVAASFAARAAS